MSSNDVPTGGRLTRAQLLKRSAAMGLGLSSLGALAACGSSSSSSGGGSASTASGPPAAADVKGTIVLLNYPGWIGKDTISGFESRYPGAKVRETAAGFESLSGVAEAVAQDPTAYDLMLGTFDACKQLEAGGFVMKVDEKTVPNLANIDARYRKLYPWGVPADTGAIGIGYRTDLVKEPIKSWADFWKLVPKYSQKVVVVGVDRDAIGSALLYLGKDGNSTNPDDLAAAKKALIELKPHIRAFKVTDIAKSLLNGTAALTMGYNYETAHAALTNPNIKFVVPEEGVVGYIEGFIALSKTDNAATAQAYLNYIAQPKLMAAQSNATLTGPISAKAKPFMDKSLLAPAYDLPANTTPIDFLGADGIKLWAKTWSEIQAA